MDDTKKKKLLKAIEEGKVTDQTTLGVFQMIEELNTRLDEEIPKITDVIARMKGDTGEIGEQGIQGEKGDKGEPGINGKDGRDGRDGRDGKDGKNGKDGFNGNDGVNGADGNIKDLSPQEVRDLLELLQGEERFDAKYIKNLPEATRELVRGFTTGIHGALYSLSDVDVAGIAIGQSIKWDGVRWIPFTPAGGTTTSVYNEVVVGNTTTFTLAHTPTLATERVYANGQRLTPTVDYTIAGAVITTVSTWSTSQITCDYQY